LRTCECCDKQVCKECKLCDRQTLKHDHARLRVQFVRLGAADRPSIGSSACAIAYHLPMDLFKEVVHMAF
jgi:hypothetical protein